METDNLPKTVVAGEASESDDEEIEIPQESKPKKRRLKYNRGNLQKAYEATLKGTSVYRAAREYNVPESTLRDRTRGQVDLDCSIGTCTYFTKEEEQQLVNNIKYMADIGYGLNKTGIQYVAQDYGKLLAKKMNGSGQMSSGWFYRFWKRWPDLKIAKPQKVSCAKEKSASRETIDKYYKELDSILTTNNLKDKPQSIYNIDKTSIGTVMFKPEIDCSEETNAQTSDVIIFAGGNALGNRVPPFYVFPGKRWNDDFLKGCSPGSDGIMLKDDLSTSAIFHTYLTRHFVKYANLSNGPTLVLYDGNKYHISLTLADWADGNNVIFFVLPPHASHPTQPLGIGDFGSFKIMYNHECQSYLKKNPKRTITKKKVAELTAKPYLTSLSPENLISGFQKTGIHPFKSNVISNSHLGPSNLYRKEDRTFPDEIKHIVSTFDHEADMTSRQTDNKTSKQERDELTTEESQTSIIGNDFMEFKATTISHSSPEEMRLDPASFCEVKTMASKISRTPKRKVIQPLSVGNLIKKSKIDVPETAAKKSKKLC